MHLGVAFVAVTDIDIGSKQSHADRGFEFGRPFVGDVEHRGHPIPIAGIKTAGGEADIIDHLGIDET